MTMDCHVILYLVIWKMLIFFVVFFHSQFFPGTDTCIVFPPGSPNTEESVSSFDTEASEGQRLSVFTTHDSTLSDTVIERHGHHHSSDSEGETEGAYNIDDEQNKGKVVEMAAPLPSKPEGSVAPPAEIAGQSSGSEESLKTQVVTSPHVLAVSSAGSFPGPSMSPLIGRDLSPNPGGAFFQPVVVPMTSHVNTSGATLASTVTAGDAASTPPFLSSPPVNTRVVSPFRSNSPAVNLVGTIPGTVPGYVPTSMTYHPPGTSVMPPYYAPIPGSYIPQGYYPSITSGAGGPSFPMPYQAYPGMVPVMRPVPAPRVNVHPGTESPGENGINLDDLQQALHNDLRPSAERPHVQGNTSGRSTPTSLSHSSSNTSSPYMERKESPEKHPFTAGRRPFNPVYPMQRSVSSPPAPQHSSPEVEAHSRRHHSGEGVVGEK